MTVKVNAHPNKGKKFLDFLNSKELISRRDAIRRWDMNNPSAWVKKFVDEGLIKGELQRIYRFRYNTTPRSFARIRQVCYQVIEKK